MLLELLKYSDNFSNAEIKENFESARIIIRPEVYDIGFIIKVFDELKNISQRDAFELFLEIEGTTEKICDCTASSLNTIKQHTAEYPEANDLEIEIKIAKEKKDSTISVYFFETFIDYISELTDIDTVKIFSRHINSRLFFEVFSTIKKFNSATIFFSDSGTIHNQLTEKSIPEESNRKGKIQLLHDNVTTTNFDINLTPDDFYLINKSESEKVNTIFERITSTLSLIFISNTTTIGSDNSIYYKISGYKAVTGKNTDIDFTDKKAEILHKIYSWSYHGGNNSDKLGLVRNVLSIHTDPLGTVLFDDEAWTAIRSNYQIYLKENVQSYLEIKNKIGEFLIDSYARTHAISEEIVKSFKSNIFALLTFILTVILVNGLKDNGVNKIFSIEYLAIVIFLCIFSFIWRKITKEEAINQFERSSEAMKEALKDNYRKVLMASEIEESVDTSTERNRAYLSSQIEKYSRWWKIILLTLGITYFLSTCIFHYKTEIHNASKNILQLNDP